VRPKDELTTGMLGGREWWERFFKKNRKNEVTLRSEYRLKKVPRERKKKTKKRIKALAQGLVQIKK